MDSFIGLAAHTLEIVRLAADALSTVCNEASQESQEPIDVRIQVLIFEVESAVEKLVQWQQEWIPENVKSEAYFLTLWGQSGQQEIIEHLKNIQKPARLIEEQAAALKKTIADQFKTSGKTSSGGWFRWLFSLPSFRDQSRTVQDRLKKTNSELVSSVAKLCEDADIQFRLMHAATRRQEISLKDRLDDVLESRTLSTAIYECCEQIGRALNLDLNLLNNDREIDNFSDIFDWLDLGPTFLLAWTDPSDEQVVRHLRLEPRSTDESYDEECDLFQLGTDWLGLLDTDPKAPFDVEVPKRNEKHKVYLRGQCFRSKFTRLGILQPFAEAHPEEHLQQTNPNSLLSRSQKIYLAYRIVETSLFLLGTPWLSHLSLEALMKTEGSQFMSQWSLRVDLDEPKAISDLFLPSAEASQIRRIGIVLIEMALETPFQTFDGTNDYLLDQVKVRLEAETGLLYLSACEYCLETHNDGRNTGCSTDQDPVQISRLLLEGFYSNVYLRLRESLHNIL